MTYDDWKQQPPPEQEYEEENTCSFCGDPIQDGERYCSDYCRKGDIAENG